jgi:hypothetical protein
LTLRPKLLWDFNCAYTRVVKIALPLRVDAIGAPGLVASAALLIRGVRKKCEPEIADCISVLTALSCRRTFADNAVIERGRPWTTAPCKGALRGSALTG